MVKDLIGKGGQQNWMTAVAALLGFFSALRVCEYIQRDQSVEGHVITAGDVRFLHKDSARQWTPAWQLRGSRVSLVVGMQVTLRSAKNDQRAEGSSWSFYKEMEVPGEPVVELMARWATQAYSRRNDPFLSYRVPGREDHLVALQYRGFNAAIKASAAACGFHPGDFGTHSLRIGALTQLAAAGVPLEVAQRTARHQSSKSTAKYQKESKAERGLVIRALADGQVFRQEDIWALAGKNKEGNKEGEKKQENASARSSGQKRRGKDL
jgi:hypothetical protein